MRVTRESLKMNMGGDSAEIDRICDEFEDEWRAGRIPSIQEFVLAADERLRLPLAQELIPVDEEFRRKRNLSLVTRTQYAELLKIPVEELGESSQLTADSTLITGHAPKPVAANGPHGSEPSEFPKFSGYTILGELGRGGMGVVYKAQQERPARIVALKTIHAVAAGHEEYIQRFRAEADAAGKLSHPGIVPIYATGEENGIHFISMGYVEGIDLDKMLDGKALPCLHAARIARDVALALHYAHEQKVVHRDIKPQNILMDADGNPRVTDFGLAKLVEDSDLTSSGQILGTAAYMPPEQAQGDTALAGPTADVYALGATLYRAITGRPPFQAASQMEILRQVVHEEPVPPRRLNQEIDADIETICLKCLEKSPSARFATAKELAEELTRYLNGESIYSRPVSGLTRLGRWCRRKPFAAASALLAAVLVIALSTAIPLILLARQKLETERFQNGLQRAEDQAAIDRATAEKEKVELQAKAEKSEMLFDMALTGARSEVRSTHNESGWTWRSLDRIQDVMNLSTDEDGHQTGLRTLIADLIGRTDVRERFSMGVEAQACVVVSPSGRYLALADNAGLPISEINLFEIADFLAAGSETIPQSVITCSVDTLADKLKMAAEDLLSEPREFETKNEGIRAIQFSPDESKLLAATRNGNIVLWDLTTTPPTCLFNRRFAGKQIFRVDFTNNPDQVVFQARWPWESSILSLESGELDVDSPVPQWDFAKLSDGRLLRAGNHDFRNSTADDLYNRRILQEDERLYFARLLLVSDDVAGIVSGNSIHFV
ncbi:MAG: WD40 repeat domain-containing serine/threonine protein kinase [Planctomycetaceae bacterium]